MPLKRPYNATNKYMEKIKYIMYCRKSKDSEDKQVQSIGDQERILDKIVKERNLILVKRFGESKSAKKQGRPLFNEMVEMIEKGEANGILCWKLDRLARNGTDGGRITDHLSDGIIKAVTTPSREFFPDSNVLLMCIEFGMAKQFVKDLSENVIRGLGSKVEKGWKPGPTPLGYINDPHGLQGEKRIFKDPERFEIVHKMWKLVITGKYTAPQAIKKTNEWGLRTIQRKNKGGGKLSSSAGYRIFTNPFYYGSFKYKGQVYEGKHTPMVTKEEFDRVQKFLGKRGNPRPKNQRLPFTGVIRCGECGAMITCEEKFKFIKSTQKLKSYTYHHCTKRKKDTKCFQKLIKHDDLKQQIIEYLDLITIPKEFLHWALEVLRENNKIEEIERNKILKNLQKEYGKCISKINNLIQLYISPENAKRELLSEAEFKEQKNNLMNEKSSLNSQMSNFEQRIDEWIELTENTFNFATYAKHWFEKGDYEIKTNILRCLGQNFILKDKKLTIELKEPFLIIKNSLEKEPLQSLRLEPSTFVNNKRKSDHLEASFSTLNRGRR